MRTYSTELLVSRIVFQRHKNKIKNGREPVFCKVDMKIKELIDRFLFLCSVPKCVKCKEKLGYGDRGLCVNCLNIYNEHKKRDCPKCAKVLSKCSCSSDYLLAHGVKNIIKLFRYSKTEESMPSNYLIYSLKQDNSAVVFKLFSDASREIMSFSPKQKKNKAKTLIFSFIH